MKPRQKDARSDARTHARTDGRLHARWNVNVRTGEQTKILLVRNNGVCNGYKDRQMRRTNRHLYKKIHLNCQTELKLDFFTFLQCREIMTDISKYKSEVLTNEELDAKVKQEIKLVNF